MSSEQGLKGTPIEEEFSAYWVCRVVDDFLAVDVHVGETTRSKTEFILEGLDQLD